VGRLAKYHVFLALAGVTVLMLGLDQVIHVEYDDGGVGSVLFLASYLVTTPVRWISDLLWFLNGKQFLADHLSVAFAVVVGLYLLAEVCVSAWVKRRSKA
jgi:hypothetical protein